MTPARSEGGPHPLRRLGGRRKLRTGVLARHLLACRTKRTHMNSFNITGRRLRRIDPDQTSGGSTAPARDPAVAPTIRDVVAQNLSLLALPSGNPLAPYKESWAGERLIQVKPGKAITLISIHESEFIIGPKGCALGQVVVGRDIDCHSRRACSTTFLHNVSILARRSRCAMPALLQIVVLPADRVAR